MEVCTFFSGLFRLTINSLNDDYTLSIKDSRKGEYQQIESVSFPKPVKRLDLIKRIDDHYSTDFDECLREYEKQKRTAFDVYKLN